MLIRSEMREQTANALADARVHLPAASNEELVRQRDDIVARATALMRASRVDDAVSLLRRLEFGTVDDQTLSLTDSFIDQIVGQRFVVATFDPCRIPANEEVV